MDNKEVEPPAGPEQDQSSILCVTLIGICILLILRVPLNDYITVLVAIAQLICRVRSQRRRKKRQLRGTAAAARVEPQPNRRRGEVGRERPTGGDAEGSGREPGGRLSGRLPGPPPEGPDGAGPVRPRPRDESQERAAIGS
jgi:hypothetical protein